MLHSLRFWARKCSPFINVRVPFYRLRLHTFTCTLLPLQAGVYPRIFSAYRVQHVRGTGDFLTPSCLIAWALLESWWRPIGPLEIALGTVKHKDSNLDLAAKVPRRLHALTEVGRLMSFIGVNEGSACQWPWGVSGSSAVGGMPSPLSLCQGSIPVGRRLPSQCLLPFMRSQKKLKSHVRAIWEPSDPSLRSPIGNNSHFIYYAF